jgi:Camelysin metallo-endopeptidase
MPKKTTLTKMLLSLAALGAVSIAAIGGTFANFSATPTSISSNGFATGTLTMNRAGSGVIFNASAMKIGQEATGSVTIQNTGSLAGVYKLDGAATGDASLISKLHLTIYKDTDGSGTPVYDGAFGGLTSAALGTFAANGDSHTFYFHVSLPSTGSDAGDNLLQGLAASESFTWSATQV